MRHNQQRAYCPLMQELYMRSNVYTLAGLYHGLSCYAHVCGNGVLPSNWVPFCRVNQHVNVTKGILLSAVFASTTLAAHAENCIAA